MEGKILAAYMTLKKKTLTNELTSQSALGKPGENSHFLLFGHMKPLSSVSTSLMCEYQ